MLSASSAREWFNRRGAGSRIPGPWGAVSANSEPNTADSCAINLRKTKKPTCRSAAVGWLKSCMETLLQSWLSTHTGHSCPRRQVLTTTGSGNGGKAVHNDLGYLTWLGVTNAFFASQLSMELNQRVFRREPNGVRRPCRPELRFLATVSKTIAASGLVSREPSALLIGNYHASIFTYAFTLLARTKQTDDTLEPKS